jgi:hypothetical protein
MSLFRVSLALIVCAACTEPPQTGTITAAQIGDDCGAVCGNAAKLFGPFNELDMTGTTPSPLGGYRITKFHKDGIELTLTVAGFDVIGRAGNLKLTNGELVGAVFDISQLGNPSHVEVTIAAVGSTRYYEGGDIDEEEVLPTFQLKFQVINGLGEAVGPLQFVCPGEEYNPQDLLDRHALLFSGTRYSIGGAVTKTGAEAHPWFNVSCRDTAEWKAAEFRLVAVAETQDFPSEPNDYTTAVRSIRADYCGDGTAHTVLGTHVDWENRGDWLWKDDGLVLEAIWNETGAICKGTPRIAGGFDDAGCKIRTCTSRDKANWRAEGYLMATWVPPPPPILIAP